MNNDAFILHEWEKEKMDNIILDKTKELGFVEGKELGKEENAIKIIKNLLKDKVSLDNISKYTGKSTKEIEEIKNNE